AVPLRYLRPQTRVGRGPGRQGLLQRALPPAVQREVKEGESVPCRAGSIPLPSLPALLHAVSPCCPGCSAWPSLPLCRSVIVENSASSTNATEILKPVKKRKRKDYQSPSEEEYESEQMEKQEEMKSSVEDSAMSNLEAEAWNGNQHGASEEKKEGWSWASYLEEQKAVAAPLDLFQDVNKQGVPWQLGGPGHSTVELCWSLHHPDTAWGEDCGEGNSLCP
uniref:Uncharacterized protein n=1 Tax=Zosterops lateralis melanops TaxID=1220523 RepID=A0A8D2PR20_ZOSLA